MYGWEVTELEMSSDDAFDTMEEAYEDAKNYFEGEGYEVGDLDCSSFTLYDSGDSRVGFLEFNGFGEIVEIEKGEIKK